MNESLLDYFLNSCKQFDDKCKEAECLHNVPYMVLAQWIELVSDIIGIIMMIYLMRTKQFRKLGAIVNPNLKMIGITGLGFYFIGMVSNLVINVYLKILSFTTVGDSCGYLWNPVNCLAFRLPVYYAFVGFNVFHIMLSLERARITFIRYNTEDLLFGQIGVILMFVLPGLFTAWTFSENDFLNTRPYCFLSSGESEGYSLIVSGVILIVSDISTTILDVVVYVTNKRQLNSKLRGYELSKTFRLKETQISMRIVFPFSVIHSTLYVLFFVFLSIAHSIIHTKSDSLLQFLAATKAIYLMGVPLLLLFFRIKQRKQTDEWLVKRDHAEIYFQQFKNQIK